MDLGSYQLNWLYLHPVYLEKRGKAGHASKQGRLEAGIETSPLLDPKDDGGGELGQCTYDRPELEGVLYSELMSSQ